MLQFRLGRLLLVITAVCGCMALLTQVGMGTAEFVVVRNDLQADPAGKISGVLWCDYRGPDQQVQPFRFEIRGVQRPELLTLAPGQRDHIRFRYQAMGPLKQQDPFQAYIEHSLGIGRHAIVGYVMTDTETNVMINGFGRAS